MQIDSGVDAEAQFEPSSSPAFLRRRGEGYAQGRSYCNKKLCFCSTRRDLLARHLLALSQRTDCYFVKFGVKARDGMYLGRCFLLDEAAVGELWARYKTHPSIYCTVQDDDFTVAHRDASHRFDGTWVDDYRESELDVAD